MGNEVMGMRKRNRELCEKGKCLIGVGEYEEGFLSYWKGKDY